VLRKSQQDDFMNKKITSLLVLCLLIFGLKANAQTQALNIANTDGSVKSVKLTDIKKINFSGSNMVLNLQSGTAESVLISGVNRMYFSLYTSLNNVFGSSALSVFPNPALDIISFKNLTDTPTLISVFNVTGSKVCDLLINNNSVDISSLRKGIYLMKVGTQIVKITKL
jgi:hypothetical protein